jgi:hypothetical protein
VSGDGVCCREGTLPGERPGGCDLDHAAFRHGRLHLSRSEREHFEIGLVSGGQTWAYEIRSADGVLDVGMRLDKATGREVPYAIWTAAAQ